MPDENYARELLQLFTIGLVELNMDGTPRLDSNGQPIETYTNDDVGEIAKVFTGLSLKGTGFWNRDAAEDGLYSPLQGFPEQHEPGPKTFLGTTIPEFVEPTDTVDAALDHIFEHPNVAPFVSRQLIQRFTQSSPDPAYVRRVAEAFENGRFVADEGQTFGTGERGDLEATLAAILLDGEMLSGRAGEGKVREPVLRFIHAMRALDFADREAFNERLLNNASDPSDRLGQHPFRSPSVFNFYRPGYIAPGTQSGDAGMTVPEFQLTNESTALGFANFLTDFLRDGSGRYDNERNTFIPDYSVALQSVDDPAALVDYFDAILTGSRLWEANRDEIINVVSTYEIRTDENQIEQDRLRRVQIAADTTGYKAMVCIFLKGGMDHADFILPTDTASYDQLANNVRPSLFNQYNADDPSSTRARESLLALNPRTTEGPEGRTFGAPSNLTAMQNWFDNGELAVVANVGPLVEPVTRDQYAANSVVVPPRLFSHNDQQSVWMSLGVEGTQTGWGGKFADAVLRADPGHNAQFTAMTMTSTDVFLAGELARQFRAPNNPTSGLKLETQRGIVGGHANADETREVLARYLSDSGLAGDAVLKQDYSAANVRAYETSQTYRDGIANAVGISTPFPSTSLGGQLKRVAEAIQVRSLFGVNRQIFYCATGGYDTHNSQANALPNLQSQLVEAMDAFRNAMIEIGEWNNVALFTGSDFGRTSVDNGDGTDHGWGGHHFVVGGAVNGGDFYGRFPSLDIGSQDYTDQRGRLIPTTSVEQYAATLGSWFGLDDGEIAAALPNLSNFDQRNLGFMNT